ncbi:MAG TPA: glycosyltransferase family 4 protein [Gemmatimonadota bacterium]|nr:glycosyltransferase family 4 protein [Gemmatimonadota bacterium]
MKVLAVAPEPFFTPRGTPFSVYYRTLVACELGATIDVLTYGEGEDVDIPGARIVRIPRFAMLGPVKAGPSLQKAFLDVFVFAWMVALLATRRYEVVHAHEEGAFMALFLKPFFGFKLVYDMHSSLPEQLSNFEFTDSRILVGIFKTLERMTLRRADAVITIGPLLGDYAREKMPDPDRHFLIENSLFEQIRLAREPTDRPAEVPLPDGRPIVIYAGSFEPYQGLDLLLWAFAQVREQRPEAFLLMIGGTPDQVEAYRRKAGELGLDGHCRFTGRIPHSRVRDTIAKATVLTSPRIAGTNTPAKIYEQVASGIPLVATRIPSHTQVLNDRICFLVDPDPAAMSEGLLAALDDGERRGSVIAAAREHYHRHWSREAYREKMEKLLEALA